MSRVRLSAVGGLLLTGFFLWLAARNVKVRELSQSLGGARWGWVLPMAAIGLVDLIVRAERWKILLGPSARAPLGLLYRLQAIGLGVNNVLFMRLGELARAFLAARELKIPLATVLSSVAVERALDVAALLSIFSLAAWFTPGIVPAAVLQGALVVLGAALAGLAALAFSGAALAPGGRWHLLLERSPAVQRLVGQLAAGASVLRAPVACAKAAALSIALWLLDACVYWCAARALALGEFIDYERAVLILAWAGAGSALPAAPGAIGTFEAAVKAVLELFGVAPAAAFGYALFVHMVMYLLVTGLGLFFLHRIGFSLRELQGALRGRTGG